MALLKILTGRKLFLQQQLLKAAGEYELLQIDWIICSHYLIHSTDYL